ncbi:hypothetical protein RJ639_024597 [Escallonia herrerae]|uniref:U-box domain-containing protein n=1 Tax=Escallonia herrerae TaxID=1293975 RepID=A0AA88V1D8_9ASTE|nr:hypothetical protein RJ639_024597 [Escallonia herrerae]
MSSSYEKTSGAPQKERAKASENSYTEEHRQRKEVEDALARGKEEFGKMEQQLEEVMKEPQVGPEQKSSLENQIANSDQMVERNDAPEKLRICVENKRRSLQARNRLRWLDSGHDTSPMTNLKLANSNLLPNHALQSAIQEWLQQPTLTSDNSPCWDIILVKGSRNQVKQSWELFVRTCNESTFLVAKSGIIFDFLISSKPCMHHQACDTKHKLGSESERNKHPAPNCNAQPSQTDT